MLLPVLSGCASATYRRALDSDKAAHAALVTLDSVITRDLQADTVRIATVELIEASAQRLDVRLGRAGSGRRPARQPSPFDWWRDSASALVRGLRLAADSNFARAQADGRLGSLSVEFRKVDAPEVTPSDPCPGAPVTSGDSISGRIVHRLHQHARALCVTLDSTLRVRTQWEQTINRVIALARRDTGWQAVPVRDASVPVSCTLSRTADSGTSSGAVSQKVSQQLDLSFHDLCQRAMRLSMVRAETLRFRFTPDSATTDTRRAESQLEQAWQLGWQQLWREYQRLESYRLAVRSRELVRIAIRQVEAQRDTIERQTSGPVAGSDSRGRVVIGFHAMVSGAHLLAAARAPLHSSVGALLELGGGISLPSSHMHPYALVATLQYDVRRRKGGVGSLVLVPACETFDVGVSVGTLGDAGVVARVPWVVSYRRSSSRAVDSPLD